MSNSICAIRKDVQFLSDSVAVPVAQQPDPSLPCVGANRILPTASSTARTASHTTSACSRKDKSMVPVNGARYTSSQPLDRPFMGRPVPDCIVLTNLFLQTSRSKVMLYPYYFILYGGFFGKSGYPATPYTMFPGCPNFVTGSMYMMSRMVLGHKTWFGKN
jgi:hypothetical protein